MTQNLSSHIGNWNPQSKEVYLINFISILTQYDELEHSPQGIALYEQVRTEFDAKGFGNEDIDKSFKLAKCMMIAEGILDLAKMDYSSQDVLQNGKILLSNIEKRDEILSSLLKDMPIN